VSVIKFGGLTPEPLLNYLAAVGIHRLTSEQQPDWHSRAFWQDDRLHLQLQGADADDVVRFLHRDYKPTPILSVWNGRASFDPEKVAGSNKKFHGVIAELEELEPTSPRLTPLLKTVRATRDLWTEADKRGLIDSGKVGVKSKSEFLRLYRATMPDDAIDWLDAAVVVLDDDESYPLVTGGTGGNIGSGDLSVNFISTLRDVFPAPGDKSAQTERSLTMLHQALFGGKSARLDKSGAFHFDFGAISGPSLSNSWLFVLAMEGALVFGAAAARNLSTQAGRAKAALPFTVRSTGIGYSSASPDEDVKGEVWAPLWETPMSGSAVAKMIGEGRADWNRRQAGDGLDFLRSIRSLGVDRSITEFSRYVMAVRNGQNVVAVPAGRHRLTSDRNVGLTSQVDRWVGRVPRSGSSEDVRTARRSLITAEWAFAEAGEPESLVDVLAAVFCLEQALYRSSKSREAGIQPLDSLVAQDWMTPMEDLRKSSAEFRVALGIASQIDRADPAMAASSQRTRSCASFFRPIEWDKNRRVFSQTGPMVKGLGNRPLDSVLSSALRARALDAAGRKDADDTAPSGPGVFVSFDQGVPTSSGDTARFAAGELDDAAIARYLQALVMLRWQRYSSGQVFGTQWQDRVRTNTIWAVAAPLFAASRPSQSSPSAISALGLDQPRTVRIRQSIIVGLSAGRGERAMAELSRLYRSLGITPIARPATAGAANDAIRAAAALLVSLSPFDAQWLRRSYCWHPDDDLSKAELEAAPINPLVSTESAAP